MLMICDDCPFFLVLLSSKIDKESEEKIWGREFFRRKIFFLPAARVK